MGNKSSAASNDGAEIYEDLKLRMAAPSALLSMALNNNQEKQKQKQKQKEENMKKIILTMIGLSLASVSAKAELVQVSCNPQKAFQAKRVLVNLSDEVFILAPGNPSTGYSWISKEGVKKGYKRNSGSEGRVGGGGIFQFDLGDLSQINRSVFTFEYKRPWLKEAPASTCRIKLILK